MERFENVREGTRQVGEVTQVIDVSASDAGLSDPGKRSTLITSKDIQKLSIEGRDVGELVKILPDFAIAQTSVGTWTPNPDGSATAHVAVLAVLLSVKGTMLSHTLRAMSATAHARTDLQDAARNADFSFVIAADTKAEKVRFIVRDASSGRMGSSE